MIGSMLEGRVALVTGSGRGIGAAIALLLAQFGADVAVNDIDEHQATATARKIEALNRRALVRAQDVSDYRGAQALVDDIKRGLGRVDILVNNAAIVRDGLLPTLTEEKWDEVIRVDLKGPFNMGQACARVMIEQRYGRIVNVASAAWRGNVGQSNYSAAKAGVVGLTRTWALELAPYGITVNAVAPGVVDSAMTRSLPPAQIERYLGRIPLRRVGRTDDVANLVAFLSSDLSKYVTGQCIHVDGGLSVGISTV